MDIPQDIIDNVIAAVGDDTHLLKQCALVFLVASSSSPELPSKATKYAFGFINFSSKIRLSRVFLDSYERLYLGSISLGLEYF